jgi:hypothetical protein
MGNRRKSSDRKDWERLQQQVEKEGFTNRMKAADKESINKNL